MFAKAEHETISGERMFRIKVTGVGWDDNQTVLGRWTEEHQVATVLAEGRECIAVANAAVGGDAMAPDVVVYGLR